MLLAVRVVLSLSIPASMNAPAFHSEAIYITLHLLLFPRFIYPPINLHNPHFWPRTFGPTFGNPQPSQWHPAYSLSLLSSFSTSPAPMQRTISAPLLHHAAAPTMIWSCWLTHTVLSPRWVATSLFRGVWLAARSRIVLRLMLLLDCILIRKFTCP